MPGILDYIQGVGGRITSTKRDPNSPLGRANPRSYHNIGQAVDVAPIPGMSFEQYVAGLKSAGFPIIEALDEAKHPLKHTTGPNWHIAYGKGQPMLGQSPFPYQPGQTDPLAPLADMTPQYGFPMQPMQQESPSVLSQGSISDLMQLDPATLMQNMPRVEDKKPGFLGKGGAGWTILGYLGDAIAQHYGGQPIFARMQAEKQQDERDQLRRLEEYRQRVAAQRDERLNTPYRFQNNAGDVVQLDPSTGQQRVLYMDPVNKPEYARVEDPATGAIEIRPQPNTQRPTRAHIEALLANPDRAADFDAKFGQGLSAYILGNRR